MYAMSGVVENMTPTPTLLAEPTRVRLRLEGPEVLRVEYVRDRRQNADIDQLTVHWPEMEASPMRIGNAQEAGIAVTGGRRELWVQIRAEGDTVNGRLVSKQTGLKMDMTVAPKYAATAGVAALQESLSEVDRIEIDANFSGTWRDLNLKLSSNLGPIMKRATQQALEEQLRHTQDKMTSEIAKVHLEQSTQLRKWLSTQAGEARELLAKADRSIEEMSQKVLSATSGAEAVLGSRLRSALESRLR